MENCKNKCDGKNNMCSDCPKTEPSFIDKKMEEFDEKFSDEDGLVYQNHNDIKNFISESIKQAQEIQEEQTKKEIKEKICKMEKKLPPILWKEEHEENLIKHIYNHTLKDILNIIN